MSDYSALIAANETRWHAAKLTRSFSMTASKILAGKPRYQIVEKRTNVPWWVIGVIHEREASCSWSANIAQGDPWNKVSVHVPAGRGPFQSWEEAAYDALVNCDPHAAEWKDWSAGGTMTILERYNGLGYYNKGLPSPYIWSGTDQYVKGKYVADGVFDPNAVDSQLGCAGLLLTMQAIDHAIVIGEPRPVPEPVPPTHPTNAQHAGAAAAVFAAIAALINANTFGQVFAIVLIAAIIIAVIYLAKRKGG